MGLSLARYEGTTIEHQVSNKNMQPHARRRQSPACCSTLVLFRYWVCGMRQCGWLLIKDNNKNAASTTIARDWTLRTKQRVRCETLSDHQLRTKSWGSCESGRSLLFCRRGALTGGNYARWDVRLECSVLNYLFWASSVCRGYRGTSGCDVRAWEEAVSLVILRRNETRMRVCQG